MSGSSDRPRPPVLPQRTHTLEPRSLGGGRQKPSAPVPGSTRASYAVHDVSQVGVHADETDDFVTADTPSRNFASAPHHATERDSRLSAPVPDRTTSSSDADFYAPTRPDSFDRAQGNAPIIEARSVTGRSLTLVIAIMCCLACLTAGAVYLINQSASAWLRDVANEVTIQVEPKEKADPEKLLRDVAAFATRQPGIRSARPLSNREQAGLLEPWLGQSDILENLPVPRLIAIEIDRATPPDIDAFRSRLSQEFPGATLDDHRQWQAQIRAVTRSFALGGLAVLMLVGAATTAIIVSATKSALASNREIVEVLHFVGATDRFIAREFERHFLRLGIRAGVVGAAIAIFVFLLLPSVMQLLGGGAVTLAEIRRLVGDGVLDAPGYLLLCIVVVVVAALCMLTSRLGVYRILNSQH